MVALRATMIFLFKFKELNSKDLAKPWSLTTVSLLFIFAQKSESV